MSISAGNQRYRLVFSLQDGLGRELRTGMRAKLPTGRREVSPGASGFIHKTNKISVGGGGASLSMVGEIFC